MKRRYLFPILLALSTLSTRAWSDSVEGPAIRAIRISNTLQTNATFYVSSGTVTNLRTTTLKFNDGTSMTTAASGSGGSSASIAVATGSTSGFNGAISSPTAVINLSSDTFLAQLKGSATAFITLNSSSVTLQGQSVLSLSSATATYIQIASSGAFLTTSSATANFLSLSSATANFLSLSSASATYLNKLVPYISSVNVTAALTTTNNGTAGSTPQIGINSSSVTAYGPNIPAASISAGSLGASVLASSLTATGVTAASYTNPTLTVNDQGRITSATSGTSGYAVDPATITFLLNKGFKASTGTYTSLSPGVMQIVATSSNVTTGLVSLSSNVTGVLPLANMAVSTGIIGVSIDSGLTGSTSSITIPYGFSISSWTFTAPNSSTATIHISSSSQADYEAGRLSNISAAGNGPSISGTRFKGAAVSSWSQTTFTGVTVISFVLDTSASTAGTIYNLVLWVLRTG